MMILLEVALLVCILYLGIKASISDCQYSLIPNQLLIQVFPVVAALDTIYYGFFVRDIILEALFNLVFVGKTAYLFYPARVGVVKGIESSSIFYTSFCISDVLDNSFLKTR